MQIFIDNAVVALIRLSSSTSCYP